MNRFPWLESLLVVAMAVALIVKPPSRVVSASTSNVSPAPARVQASDPVHRGDGRAGVSDSHAKRTNR